MNKAARILLCVAMVVISVMSSLILLGTRVLFSTATILVIGASAFYTLRSMLEVKLWTPRAVFSRYVALMGLALALIGAAGYAVGSGMGDTPLILSLPIASMSVQADVDQILNLSSILLAVSASIMVVGCEPHR